MKYLRIISRPTIIFFAILTGGCGVKAKDLQPVIALNQQHLGELCQNVAEQL